MIELKIEFDSSLKQLLTSIDYYTSMKNLELKAKDSEIMRIYKLIMKKFLFNRNAEEITKIKLITRKGKPKERLRDYKKNILKYIACIEEIKESKNKDIYEIIKRKYNYNIERKLKTLNIIHNIIKDL